MFILYALLRQKAIPQEAYTQVNNLLAESLGENDERSEEMDVGDAAENEENEDVVKNRIQFTADEIIHHDKKRVRGVIKRD